MAQAANAVGAAAHGAANGRGTHGGVVHGGGATTTDMHTPGHTHGHSIGRRPVDGNTYGENVV